MQKPDLGRMWETWIPLDIPLRALQAHRGTFQEHQEWFNKVVDAIRSQVCEVVSILTNKQIVDWYHFLIHEKDGKPCIHIRVSIRKGVDSKDFLDSLPSYCLESKPIERKAVESIDGVDKPLLKNEEIEEAWRIIGELFLSSFTMFLIGDIYAKWDNGDIAHLSENTSPRPLFH